MKTYVIQGKSDIELENDSTFLCWLKAESYENALVVFHKIYPNCSIGSIHVRCR